MLPLLITIITIALIYWVFRMKRKGMFRRHKTPTRAVTQIQGSEVRVFLGPQTPLEHLRVDGIRFGESFKLKQPPSIQEHPDNPFEIVDLSYASNDVFDGALNANSPRQSVIGEINHAQARQLKTLLKQWHTRPPHQNFEDLWNQAELDQFDESEQQQLHDQLASHFTEPA